MVLHSDQLWALTPFRCCFVTTWCDVHDRIIPWLLLPDRALSGLPESPRASLTCHFDVMSVSIQYRGYRADLAKNTCMAIRRFAASLLLACAYPHQASATTPFTRSQLSSILMLALVDIAHHGVQDVPYARAKLGIPTNSPWADYDTGNINHKVTAADFDREDADGTASKIIEATGDVLPLRSGKYWNLRLQYILEPAIKDTSYHDRIEIVDVEEYSCITTAMIGSFFPGTAPSKFSDSGNSAMNTSLYF